MILTCVTAPQSEPITIEDVQGQCRIGDLSAEAATIAYFISAIRERAEAVLRRALVTQVWNLTLDKFPKGREPLYLPLPPLQAVNTITYVDRTQTAQGLSNWRVINDSNMPAFIVPAYNTVWPTTLDDYATVNVEFTCGYGPIENATDLNIPIRIIQWMLLNIANLYENRETEGVAYRETVFDISTIADNLIESLRVPRL